MRKLLTGIFIAIWLIALQIAYSFELAQIKGSGENMHVWRVFFMSIINLFYITIGLFVIAILALLVWGWGYRILVKFKENQIRKKLIAQGRYKPWATISEKLSLGQGTLIVQCSTINGGGYFGPIRIWWTEDDIIECSPVELPASIEDKYSDDEKVIEYSRLCALRYVNIESGIAFLTGGEEPGGRMIDRIISESSNKIEHNNSMDHVFYCSKLSECYPEGKIVALVYWDGKSDMLYGDADIRLNGSNDYYTIKRQQGSG
jgi:hypothetical protein